MVTQVAWEGCCPRWGRVGVAGENCCRKHGVVSEAQWQRNEELRNWPVPPGVPEADASWEGGFVPASGYRWCPDAANHRGASLVIGWLLGLPREQLLDYLMN